MTIRHNDVKWPQGFLPFYVKVREHRDKILTGTMICIDPASGGTSLPGFCICVGGEVLTSGTIDMGPRKLPIYERLQVLHDRVMKLTPTAPDVFCLEMIRGQNFSHHYLHWAIGTSIAAARTNAVVEIPMHAWRPVSKITPGYIKGDAADAECMAVAMLLLAQKFTDEAEKAS